jgi:2-keto-3-deoxy-L-rhamnonate aldolase RhmA
MTFRVKEKLRAGQPVVGTMLTECLSPEVAPLLAAAGLDFFIIDTEHSPADLAQIEALARVARAAGVAPLVRITENESFLIARALDCGAAGVVAPRINSAADARQVVAAVKYAPEGRRGLGMRGILTDYRELPAAEAMARANQQTIVVVQVESAEAVDELSSTVAVPGIDATMVGPYDLSLSLGVPGELNHPKFNAALERIAGVCAASPVAAGIHLGDAARLAECLRMGYRFLIYSTDMALLLKALREALQHLRGEATTVSAPGMY